MSKNLNIKTLEVDKKQFFMLWLKFLKPYHHLAEKEMEFLSILLLKRNELSEIILDDSLLDSMLFDKKIRNEIKDIMGYSSMQVYNNMLSFLRKKKVIVNNKIIKGLIPDLKNDSTNYKLVLNFNIK